MVLLWIISHFLVLFFIFKPNKIAALISLGLLLFVYTFKEPTYDLIYYYLTFENPQDYIVSSEIFFQFLNILFNMIGFNAVTIHFIYSLFIFIFIYKSIKNMNILKEKDIQIDIIVIILSSLFFFLGTQNIIRQGLALSMLLYSISLFPIRKMKLFSILVFILAIFIHYSIIVIGCIYIFTLILNKYFPEGFVKYILTLFFSIIFVFLFKIVLISSSYSQYLDQDFTTGTERTIGIIKYLVILITTLFLGLIKYFNLKKISQDSSIFTINKVFNIKVLYLIIITPLAFDIQTEEIFSRLVVFLYVIELLQIVLLYKVSNIYTKSFSLILIMLYGFAPNIINILLFNQK